MIVGLNLARKAARHCWGYTDDEISRDPDGQIAALAVCSDHIANKYTYDWLMRLCEADAEAL